MNFTTKLTVHTVFALATIGLFAPLPIFSQTRNEADIRRGIECHNAARENPEGNIEEGKNLLGSRAETDAVARAYYGSLLTIEAGLEAERKNLVKSLNLLDEGSRYIDEAVNRDPDNAEIRIVRVTNAWAVSNASPLNRFQVIQEDLKWYDSGSQSLSREVKGIFELHRGLYLVKAQEIERALDAFDACIALSPASPEAAEAARQLARYAE